MRYYHWLTLLKYLVSMQMLKLTTSLEQQRIYGHNWLNSSPKLQIQEWGLVEKNLSVVLPQIYRLIIVYRCTYMYYVHMYVYMYVCMYVCTYVCMYVCMYLIINKSIYQSIYPSMYLSIYLCIYLCIYLLYVYITQAKLPELFKLDIVRRKFDENITPTTVVLLQELERFNKLIRRMSLSLSNLQKVCLNNKLLHSFIHPSIHSFIHPFIHSFIHLFIHSFIHPSIHSFIHLSIHLFAGISW